MRLERHAPRLMVTPAVVVLVVFAILPFLLTLALSVSRSTLARPLQGFIGLEHYQRALSDRIFGISLRNTFALAIGATVVETLLGFALALLLQGLVRGAQVVRTAALLPMITPPIAVGMIWKLLYNPAAGAINHYLRQSGVLEGTISFLGNSALALPAIGLADVWEWTPFVFLLSYAALMTLPQDVFEAAAVDGASPLGVFRHIILPMVAPTLLAIALLRLIMAFKVFDLVYFLTFGGPGFDTTVTSFYIWKVAFTQFQTGYASALTVLLLVILTLVATVLSRARDALRRRYEW